MLNSLNQAVDISMIIGEIMLGMSVVVFIIRAMHFVPLLRHKNADSIPDIQSMKKIVQEGQGLMLIAFALICATFYFSLNVPFYVLIFVFAGCVIFTGLDT